MSNLPTAETNNETLTWPHLPSRVRWTVGTLTDSFMTGGLRESFIMEGVVIVLTGIGISSCCGLASVLSVILPVASSIDLMKTL